MAWYNIFGGKSKKKEDSAGADSAQAAAATADKPAEAPPAEKPQKLGFFGRIKAALKKTVQILNTDIRDLVGKEGRLVDADFLTELYAHLIKTDMGTGPAGEIRDRIAKQFRARVVKMRDLINSAKETIHEIMDQPEVPIRFADSGPTVIMVCGVNGSGKTTSIAKLAHMFRQDGKSVVVGAGDTFRAAAVDQLKIWAERVGADIVTGKQGGDPASVAYQAVDRAVKTNADVCIVDTAGRLQTQKNLMEQLSKIRRVITKVVVDAPHEVLLVLDATAGQNGLSQARGFSEVADCTGIVLAKLDGTAKGGVAIPIRKQFNLPVKYVGTGEKAEDLALFNVDDYVTALFADVDPSA